MSSDGSQQRRQSLDRVTSLEAFPPTPQKPSPTARRLGAFADGAAGAPPTGAPPTSGAPPTAGAPPTQALLFGREFARTLAEQRVAEQGGRLSASKGGGEKLSAPKGGGGDKPRRSRLRHGCSSGALSASRSTDPDISQRDELLQSLSGSQARAALKPGARAEAVVRGSPTLARRASAVVEQLASKVGLDGMIDGMGVALEGAP